MKRLMIISLFLICASLAKAGSGILQESMHTGGKESLAVLVQAVWMNQNNVQVWGYQGLDMIVQVAGGKLRVLDVDHEQASEIQEFVKALESMPVVPEMDLQEGAFKLRLEKLPSDENILNG